MELREGLSVDFSKNRERARIRKSKTPRPGTTPWAVLRFFYRSKEAIARAELPLTFKHPLVKAVAHELQFEPVPDFPKPLSIETESTSASEGKPSCISTPASVHTNEVMRNFTKHCSTASVNPIHMHFRFRKVSLPLKIFFVNAWEQLLQNPYELITHRSPSL